MLQIKYHYIWGREETPVTYDMEHEIKCLRIIELPNCKMVQKYKFE
jgi:hypothetical protein